MTSASRVITTKMESIAVNKLAQLTQIVCQEPVLLVSALLVTDQLVATTAVVKPVLQITTVLQELASTKSAQDAQMISVHYVTVPLVLWIVIVPQALASMELATHVMTQQVETTAIQAHVLPILNAPPRTVLMEFVQCVIVLIVYVLEPLASWELPVHLEHV